MLSRELNNVLKLFLKANSGFLFDFPSCETAAKWINTSGLNFFTIFLNYQLLSLDQTICMEIDSIQKK